ncbi:MAG: MOSC domain-containing protein [Pseudomonadota bacterium]
MSGAFEGMVARHAAPGQVRWIGVRTARRGAVEPREAVEILDRGLDGDRRERPGKRAVTLIQWEHLAVISSLLGLDRIEPADLRRNIVISGINLVALRKSPFRVGTTLLRGTGICAPCSRMEEVFGPGGFTAVRGHGGITAEVLEPGIARLGDAVFVSPDPTPPEVAG